MSINSTMPEILTAGKTWELLSADYVLKTISSGTGGESSDAAATGGPSNNTSGGPSNNTSGGPSNNSTGAVTLTAAQSGCPAHTHAGQANGFVMGNSSGDLLITNGNGAYKFKVYSSSGNNTAKNATSSHSHTLNSHTHSLQSHTHTLSSHTHTTGMPANIGIYVWKRTA